MSTWFASKVDSSLDGRLEAVRPSAVPLGMIADAERPSIGRRKARIVSKGIFDADNSRLMGTTDRLVAQARI